VQIGVTIFLTDRTIGPVDLARAAEDRGFSSVWFPEHTHIPVSRRTPAPTGEADLPEEYRRCLDPLVALTAAAVSTERLVVGSGVSLVAQHHPIDYAKSWATLDLVSGGRARFGVGFGWNVEEMHDHGVVYSTRREQAREHVLAMQALWSADEASFAGSYVEFDPTFSWPKPLQQPRIPTLLGGAFGPKLCAHLAEWADGWLPIGGAGVREALPALREAWAVAGRAGEPQVIPFGTVPSEPKLAYYESIGCAEVVLRLPAAGRDDTLRALDSYAVHVTG
jgi:probable F420-dependent oxidoreductase